MSQGPEHIAIVGAGMAGASCARLLAEAGYQVRVFDKSRGVGGRMTTRRLDWTDAAGSIRAARFDHGAIGFSSQSLEFTQFAEQALAEGVLSCWRPTLAPDSLVRTGEERFWVPTPDMPALCRSLLSDLPLQTTCAIDAIGRDASGWRLQCGGHTVGEGFDAVVLAIPPLQAAPLLGPHQAAWAQQSQALAMEPTWALMGLAEADSRVPAWDLAWPKSEVLACVVRDDAKPGRLPIPGMSQWVVHATPVWSQEHLEAPAAEVQAALQEELSQWLGHTPRWHHLAVHRWRYASTQPVPPAAANHLWDPSLALGVCGDAWGGAGVEGAWLSARALAKAVQHSKLGQVFQNPAQLEPKA